MTYAPLLIKVARQSCNQATSKKIAEAGASRTVRSEAGASEQGILTMRHLSFSCRPFSDRHQPLEVFPAALESGISSMLRQAQC